MNPPDLNPIQSCWILRDGTHLIGRHRIRWIQLGKLPTSPKHVKNTSKMRPKRVQHLFKTRPKCVLNTGKTQQKRVPKVSQTRRKHVHKTKLQEIRSRISDGSRWDAIGSDSLESRRIPPPDGMALANETGLNAFQSNGLGRNK